MASISVFGGSSILIQMIVVVRDVVDVVAESPLFAKIPKKYKIREYFGGVVQ